MIPGARAAPSWIIWCVSLALKPHAKLDLRQLSVASVSRKFASAYCLLPTAY